MSIIDVDMFKKNRDSTLGYRAKSNNEYFFIKINHGFSLLISDNFLIYICLITNRKNNIRPEIYSLRVEFPTACGKVC